jgi:hypothetical protein
MNKATPKQTGFIASLIKKNSTEYPTCETIWNSIPKNNEKYPDTRCDYQQIILAEALQNITPYEASLIIGFLTGSKDKYNRHFSGQEAFKILCREFKHLIK